MAARQDHLKAAERTLDGLTGERREERAPYAIGEALIGIGYELRRIANAAEEQLADNRMEREVQF